MPTPGEMLQAVFDSRDFEALIALMDEGIMWRGVPHGDEVPVCRDRNEVRDQMKYYRDGGGDAHPQVIAERGDSVVLDPRPSPGLDFRLYQVVTFRGPRMVLIQDYRKRATALAAIG